MRLLAGLIASLALWPMIAGAVSCREEIFESNRFTVCEVDSGQEDLRIFLRDSDEQSLGHFEAVDNALAEDETLSFAMNGGMYHPDRRPVGYYVENGVQSQKLYPNAGPGNFGLVPNGVFCIRDQRADVMEAKAFEKAPVACDFATQSGPMLVIDGALHPRFLATSTSKFVRNGVGTSSDGQKTVFVKSENGVTFHTFARFFRDELGLPQALFLDGKISRLYAPSIDRNDPGFRMGPIIGVVNSSNR